jgi:hypothetical protein
VAAQQPVDAPLGREEGVLAKHLVAAVVGDELDREVESRPRVKVRDAIRLI